MHISFLFSYISLDTFPENACASSAFTYDFAFCTIDGSA